MNDLNSGGSDSFDDFSGLIVAGGEMLAVLPDLLLGALLSVLLCTAFESTLGGRDFSDRKNNLSGPLFLSATTRLESSLDDSSGSSDDDDFPEFRVRIERELLEFSELWGETRLSVSAVFELCLLTEELLERLLDLFRAVGVFVGRSIATSSGVVIDS